MASSSSSSSVATFTVATSRQKPDQSPESYDSLRRRNMAAEILQSYERLSWMSLQRCESITQTRMYFKALVAGLSPDDEDEDETVVWKEDFTPHPRKAGEGPKRTSKKGKERASMGSTDGGTVRGEGSERKRKSKHREDTGGSAEATDVAID